MRAAALFGFSAVVLLGCVSCSRSSPDSLDGRYVLPNGHTVEFQGSDFRAGSAMPNGSVLVTGPTVTVRLLNGTTLEGTRVDADHIRFLKRDGALIPPLDLVRQTPSTPTQTQRPMSSEAAPPAFVPDANLPLSAYTPLRTKADLMWVSVAFRTTPPTDEELVSLFVPQASALNDAFAKHDLAVRELPALRDKLEQTRHQRYYAVAFGIPVPGQAADVLRLDARPLLPYDFNRHAFPLVLPHEPCWSVIGNLRVSETKGDCALPVADEALARQIESMRSTMTTLYTKGTVHFCVTQGARPGGSTEVTVMRTQMTLASFQDAQFSYEGAF